MTDDRIRMTDDRCRMEVEEHFYCFYVTLMLEDMDSEEDEVKLLSKWVERF